MKECGGTGFFLYTCYSSMRLSYPEPVSVDLLSNPGIDSQPGGPVRQPVRQATYDGGVDSSESIPGIHKRL